MAQWKQLEEMCKKQNEVFKRVTSILSSSRIPVLIRSKMAQWIEAQPWAELDADNQDNEQEDVYNNLIVGIQEAESKEEDVMGRMNLSQALQSLQQAFGTNYRDFVQSVKRCLDGEKLIMQSLQDQGTDRARKGDLQRASMAEENPVINEKLDNLNTKVRSLEHLVSTVTHNQASFWTEYNDLNGKQEKLQKQLRKCQQQQVPLPQEQQKELQETKTRMQQSLQTNTNQRLSVLKCHLEVHELMEALIKDIWAEIDKYILQQKLYITYLDATKHGIEEILDRMCTRINQSWLTVLQAIDNTQIMYQAVPYPNDTNLPHLLSIKAALEAKLPEHLSRCFLVTQNIPNQIQKIGSGQRPFNMAVRLFGGAGLHLSLAPKVNASLYSEKELAKAVQGAKAKANGNIVNGQNRVLETTENGRCLASFSSSKLEKVQRPDRTSNDELVTEQKHGILFTTELRVRETPFQLKAVSLPIVLVSQTSQDCMAKGSLIWDAAFSEIHRCPFEHKEKVQWSELKPILSSLFLAKTNRGLSEDNLNKLAEVAFSSSKETPQGNYDELFITEKQLIKDKLPASKNARSDGFSFWKWFWANMNLCGDLIRTMWQDGIVHGFISKEEARTVLQDQPLGTFLLRFSETSIDGTKSQKADFCGHLTVAVVEIDPNTGSKEVFFIKDSLKPKDLAENDLALILQAFEVADYGHPGQCKDLLTALYPDIHTPFEAKFAKYIKEKVENSDGYVPLEHKIKIKLAKHPPAPGANAAPLSPLNMPSTPGSPQDSMYASSPGSAAPSTPQLPSFAHLQVSDVNSSPTHDTMDIDRPPMTQVLYTRDSHIPTAVSIPITSPGTGSIQPATMEDVIYTIATSDQSSVLPPVSDTNTSVDELVRTLTQQGVNFVDLDPNIVQGLQLQLQESPAATHG